ncbi:hypothetical protein ACLKA7_001924 [Drosophila subpalustris]
MGFNLWKMEFLNFYEIQLKKATTKDASGTADSSWTTVRTVGGTKKSLCRIKVTRVTGTRVTYESSWATVQTMRTTKETQLPKGENAGITVRTVGIATDGRYCWNQGNLRILVGHGADHEYHEGNAVTERGKRWDHGANLNSYKDSGGNTTFAELAKVAIDLLSLPWSNAEVERIFSQVNLVKSKLRNKLHLSTLNSVLYIRYGLRRFDQCCYSYKVPNKFLRMIGTRLSYENENQENGDNIDEIIHCL